MPENGLQFFQLQKRGNTEQIFSVETNTRHQDMAVRVKVEEVTEDLNGDDGAGKGILFGTAA